MANCRAAEERDTTCTKKLKIANIEGSGSLQTEHIISICFCGTKLIEV